MNRRRIKSTRTEKKSDEGYLDIELEPKAKNNVTARLKIEAIENKIFEDIKNLISEYEKESGYNSTKDKIIAKLKAKT